MIKSADGSAGLLHKITKPGTSREGVQILKEEEEDARLLDRSEAKRKEWAKHWQCDSGKYIICRTSREGIRNWVNVRKRCRDERRRLGKGVEIVQGKDRSWIRRLPPESPLGLDKRNKGRNRGVAGKGEAELQMAATSLYDDVFHGAEERHE